MKTNNLIAILLLVACNASVAGDSLLIENVTLVSPEQPQPLGNRHVLVRDGRIAAVSDQADRRCRRARAGWMARASS